MLELASHLVLVSNAQPLKYQSPPKATRPGLQNFWDRTEQNIKVQKKK